MSKRIERRAFLAACAAISATAAFGSRKALGQQAGFVPANLQLDPSASNQRVIGEFLGLSFDASLIPGGAFFNAGNRPLIDYVRGLGSRGVMQFGGPNLDRTSYSPDDLAKLAQFAEAVDWRIILGLSSAGDFAVADQAAKASQALGQRLMAFEIGNAPDLRYRDYGSYLAAFRASASAVVANDPTATFAGPSTASHPDWAARFAQDERPQLTALTQQYLHTGGESSLRIGVRNLGQTAAAADLPLRLERITTTNGNIAATALWSIDFAFEMAAIGAEGAHFHDNADVSQSNAPIYLGLQLFSQSVNARFVQPHLQTTNNNFTAWAVERDDHTRLVTLINRDNNVGATLTLDAGRPVRTARIKRLTALSTDTAEMHVVDWRQTDLSSVDIPPASAALLVF